jgi:cell division protein FtsI (penicillin-binding protein 3)
VAERVGRVVSSAGGALQGARERHRIVVAGRRAASAGRHTSVDHRKRLLILLGVFASLFALLGSKVVDLQVISPGRYLSFGEAQRTDTQVLAAERGAILDRNGDELAVSRPAQSVFVDPALIEDAPAAAAAVAPILGLEVDSVQAKMTGNNRFAYLDRKVPAETAEQIAALGLPGVAFLDESERYLPAGESGQSLLGEVDVDNKGISGLEAAYESALTGTPGRLTFERSPDGNTIAVGQHNLEEAVPGQTLTLTIDRALQYEAENALADQVQATGAKGGIAIVTKPGTGEVLAMANVVTDEETGEVLIGTNNAALTTQYEPGSVMKPVTVAAALERGAVEPSTTFYLPTTMTYYDDVIIEAEERGEVTWEVRKILEQSSNVGTVKIAEEVGPDAMYEFQRAFGFGDTTALDFPNEAAGAVLEPSDWSGTSLPTIAIGQGISVSPMQMLMAYNVIANEGTYVAPKLVQSTTDADGVAHPTPTSEGRRVISEETADELNLMLRSVVDQGTGQLAKIDGYNVFGKTGTARKVLENGKYQDDQGLYHYQSTFIGVVPAEQPALSVYVMIDEPSGGRYTGGTTAAPAFSRIASFALRRLGIPPAATDVALDGAPVQVEGGIPVGVAEVSDDGRLKAKVTGTPEAAPTTTVPPAGVTPTTTAVRRATG